MNGEGEIRTLGPPKRTTVFETAAFDHSATSPKIYHNFYLDKIEEIPSCFSARDLYTKIARNDTTFQIASGKNPKYLTSLAISLQPIIKYN